MSKHSGFHETDALLSDTPTSSFYTDQESEIQQLNEQDQQVTNKSKYVLYQNQKIKVLPQDWRHSTLLKFQIFSCYYGMIILGISDQTVGTLFPVLIQHYQVEQTTISTVFALQFLGYTTSALNSERLHIKFGRRGVLVLSMSSLLITYMVNSFAPPIYVFIAVYYFAGIGSGLLSSCMNVWLSSIVDHNELMGGLHGSYGIGSVIAPPLISHLLKWFDNDFTVHYKWLGVLASLGLVVLSLLFQNENRLKYSYDVSNHKRVTDGDASLISVLKMPVILIFSVFMFLYTGTEISIGSWFLSYLLRSKDLDQISASYIVSLFWMGLTIGRVLIGFVTKYFKNEYRANLVYSSLFLLTFTSYALFTLNVSSEYDHFFGVTSLLIVYAGVCIGPLFPTCAVTLMKALPSKIHISAMGLMLSLGGTGAAIFPFLIGVVTSKTSLDIFPILISIMIGGFVTIWILLPRLCCLDYDF